MVKNRYTNFLSHPSRELILVSLIVIELILVNQKLKSNYGCCLWTNIYIFIYLINTLSLLCLCQCRPKSNLLQIKLLLVAVTVPFWFLPILPELHIIICNFMHGFRTLIFTFNQIDMYDFEKLSIWGKPIVDILIIYR